MNVGRTVFSQLIEYLPGKEFQKCVARYDGDSRLRGFSCWDQLLAMCFAQLTYRESLRDIEACLRSMSGKLYHMGLRGRVARSTLGDANETHDWRIYADFAQVLIGIARPLHVRDPIGVDLAHSLYALDSRPSICACHCFRGPNSGSTRPPSKCTHCWICMAIFPHLSALPTAKCTTSTSSTRSCRRPGAFYVMDRGYVDFERLYIFTLSAAFFVVRTKSNVILQRRYSHPVDKSTGVRSDHTVILTAIGSANVYPDALRRVSYLDIETRKRFKFLTNNFTLPAITIAQIYKSRWQVELFFKWIKQHLRIKAFYGTSENAVKTQIWIAVSVYVLVAIVRKRLMLTIGLYQILQILSVTLFEKTPILQALQPSDSPEDLLDNSNQLNLFTL